MFNKDTKPPCAARWLLKRCLSEENTDHRLGDFQEVFHSIAERERLLKAKLWYWQQVLKSIPKLIDCSIYWSFTMFKNYFKTAVRNLRKHKTYSLINIAGLSLGIICFILIGLYVQDELSYDQYHEKSDRIYRIGVKIIFNDNNQFLATCCAPMAGGLITEFPEIEASARLVRFGNPLIRNLEHEKSWAFSEERWFYTDSSFFDVFTVPFLKGDPKTALTTPSSIVITSSIAQKYFGNEDPIGKTLNADSRRDYMVTGVIEDVPRNSHVHYDFLASIAEIKDSRNQNWVGSNNYHTYFVLKEGISADQFEPKLKLLIDKYVHPQVKGAIGISPEQFYANGGQFNYFIQPLTGIHLESHYQFEHEPNSNIAYVYIFSIIAAAILLIAGINFVNLATAISAERAKEVGIRKTIGSRRKQVFYQFMIESIVISTIALILALFLIEFLLPQFNIFTGRFINISYFQDIYTIPLVLGTAVLIGSLAGIYPAVFLSSYDPVKVLKGSPIRKNSSPILRNGLVVFQFTVSVILIIGTIVIYRQLDYIQNTNLGFSGEQVLIIKKSDDLSSKVWPFKREILKISGVVNVTNTSNIMGEDFGDDLYRAADNPDDGFKLIWRMWTGPDFTDTYNVKLVQGKYFSKVHKDENEHVVINESAARLLGLKQSVGQKLVDSNRRNYTVIGVMEDFHYESLQTKIKPMIIHRMPIKYAGEFTSVRMSRENTIQLIEELKKTWEKFAGSQAFEYEFFDSHFEKFYLAEKKTGHIFLVFTLLAVFIAGLGLFGLAAFITLQRTKEIGIRKVLGASAGEIVYALSSQLTMRVLLANIIAWPAAYFVMNEWLNSFAYRTTIDIWTFIISGFISLILSLAVISFHTIKASFVNPVNVLKYE